MQGLFLMDQQQPPADVARSGYEFVRAQHRLHLDRGEDKDAAAFWACVACWDLISSCEARSPTAAAATLIPTTTFLLSILRELAASLPHLEGSHVWSARTRTGGLKLSANLPDLGVLGPFPVGGDADPREESEREAAAEVTLPFAQGCTSPPARWVCAALGSAAAFEEHYLEVLDCARRQHEASGRLRLGSLLVRRTRARTRT